MFLIFGKKKRRSRRYAATYGRRKAFFKGFRDRRRPTSGGNEGSNLLTCIKKLSEAVAKTPLYLTQDTETGERRAKNTVI